MGLFKRLHRAVTLPFMLTVMAPIGAGMILFEKGKSHGSGGLGPALGLLAVVFGSVVAFGVGIPVVLATGLNPWLVIPAMYYLALAIPSFLI